MKPLIISEVCHGTGSNRHRSPRRSVAPLGRAGVPMPFGGRGDMAARSTARRREAPNRRASPFSTTADRARSGAIWRGFGGTHETRRRISCGAICGAFPRPCRLACRSQRLARSPLCGRSGGHPAKRCRGAPHPGAGIASDEFAALADPADGRALLRLGQRWCPMSGSGPGPFGALTASRDVVCATGAAPLLGILYGRDNIPTRKVP